MRTQAPFVRGRIGLLLALVSLVSSQIALGDGPSAASALAGPAPVQSTTGTWQQISELFARSDHPAILDPVRRRMLVFGGFDTEARNDVLALSLDGIPHWTKLVASGSPPSPRWGHSAIYDPLRDRMIVFGGLGYNSDVWALSLGGTPTWIQLAPVGIGPGARAWHSAIYDPQQDRMIVFGGFAPDSGFYVSDVWALSLGGVPAWTRLAPGGTPPGGRHGQAVVYDSFRHWMIVVGGFEPSPQPTDTWALSLGSDPTWYFIPANGTPSGRELHSAVYDPLRDRIVMYGGRASTSIDEVWGLYLSAGPTWARLLPVGPTPGGSHDHSAIYDPGLDRMVVFGGFGPGFGVTRRNDVWVFSLGSTPSWTNLTPIGTPPQGRFRHVSILDPVRGRMLTFGGLNGGLDDTWQLSLGPDPTWTPLATAGVPPAAHWGHAAVYDPMGDRMLVVGGRSYPVLPTSRVWALQLASSPIWTELAVTGAPPAGRQDHSAIYDPLRNRVLVFGGYDASFNSHADLWELSLGATPRWTQLFPSGVPPSGRGNHGAIYDLVRDRMVVFGGAGRNDVWALSLGGSPAWTQVTPAGTAPQVYSGYTVIYDDYLDRLVVYGGSLSLLWDDVWVLTLGEPATWTVESTGGGVPNQREDHTAVYDPLGRRMIVFGGYRGDAGAPFNDTWQLVWDAPVPTLVDLESIDVESDRVSLIWAGADAAGAPGTVERRTAATDWERLASIHADGAGAFRFVDREVVPGERYGYRLGYVSGGTQVFTTEHWVDVPLPAFALYGTGPNPTATGFTVAISLMDERPAQLEVFDISGRRLVSRMLTGLAPGRHEVRIEESRAFPSGVYAVRLSHAGRSLTARATVLR